MSVAELAPPPTPRTVLASSPMPELRRLDVEASDEVVVLSGRVSSFYLKQMAQECVKTATAGRKLVNRVEVCR
jgi:osmotically-inducible protein OsmY